MSDDDAYVELSFSPNVSLVSTVRRFVGEFYGKVLKDDSVASRLVVATHELLENAVRYSSDGQSAIRIGVRPDGSNVQVTIDTRNKTNPDHRSELMTLLSEMSGAASRDSFYQVLLRRTVKRKEGSGLGLGRIHAEAELDLSCRLDGEIVHLRAEGRFPIEVRA
jgi:hypothetical protein